MRPWARSSGARPRSAPGVYVRHRPRRADSGPAANHGIMLALSLGMRRTNRRVGALALALCVASAASGCSYLFVDAPPPRSQQPPRPFTCTTSNTWPTVDVVLSGVAVLEGIGALTDTTDANSGYSSGDRTANYVNAGVAAVSAALLATSAAAGYRQTAACREATAELMNRLYMSQPAGSPSPYAPGLTQPYDPWTAPPPAPPPIVAPPAVVPPRAPDAPPGAGPRVAPTPAAPAGDAEMPQ